MRLMRQKGTTVIRDPRTVLNEIRDEPNHPLEFSNITDELLKRRTLEEIASDDWLILFARQYVAYQERLNNIGRTPSAIPPLESSAPPTPGPSRMDMLAEMPRAHMSIFDRNYPNGRGKRIRLGDMGLAEIDFRIFTLVYQVARNRNRIDRWEELKKAVLNERVTYVGELSEELVARINP